MLRQLTVAAVTASVTAVAVVVVVAVVLISESQVDSLSRRVETAGREPLHEMQQYIAFAHILHGSCGYGAVVTVLVVVLMMVVVVAVVEMNVLVVSRRWW